MNREPGVVILRGEPLLLGRRDDPPVPREGCSGVVSPRANSRQTSIVLAGSGPGQGEIVDLHAREGPLVKVPEAVRVGNPLPAEHESPNRSGTR